MKDSRIVVGFDFGTTNSLVAAVSNERVHILHNDNLPVPSIVKYEGLQKVMGQAAKEELDASELGVHGSFVKSPKTYLGRGSIVVDGIEFSPIDVTRDVIEHVRDEALGSAENDGLLSAITDAVATIPIDMDGSRRQALRDAYARAGIRVVQFVHEPFAALYGHFRPRMGTDFAQRFDRKNIMVVDWGGGTLDITLCRIENGHVVQLQNSGTSELGGDEFDNSLRNWILSQAHDGSLEVAPDKRRQLRHRCEKLKILLSDYESGSIFIRNFYSDTASPLAFEMTRTELETIAKPMIDQAMERIVALLEAARIGDAQVSMCLVTGGMSRMPLIASRLREFFGAHRVEVSRNSATLIAEGAAWIARDGAQLELAKDIEVRLARGSFYRLLKAGTRVPFEGEELSKESLEMYSSNPRDGHAKFLFCTPARPGSNTQRSDPRDDLETLSLAVDALARPFIERLILNTTLDPNGIVHVTALSDMRKDSESKSLHDLQFGISLGSGKPSAGVADDPGPPVEQEAPEIGSIVVRSNIADKKDDFYVPGDVLYKYKPTYFSRALNPPDIQTEERLYYQRCAVCGRRPNDPECHCGSR